jgi:hypothetical protein
MDYRDISGEGNNDDAISGCLECIQLKEAFSKATLALGMHHDELDSCVKDVSYIHKEAELYEANNKARRAFNGHREKVHEGMAYA